MPPNHSLQPTAPSLRSVAAAELGAVGSHIMVTASNSNSGVLRMDEGKNLNLISFQTIQKDMQPLLFCRYDPLGRLLLRVSPKNIWPIVVFALALYSLAMLGGGSVLSILYAQRSVPFLSLFDPKELPISIFAYLVTAPLVWLFYTWQPRGISNVFYRLYQNDVIGEVQNSTSQRIFKLNSLMGKIHFWLSSVVTAIGILMWLSDVYRPFNPFSFGETSLWWMLNPIYFWAIWIPLVFINLYMVAWIVFRQIAATAAFTSLFKVFQIKPKVLHPDECNGLAPVGDYSIRSALIAVFFGFWLFVFTTYPMLFGQPINLNIDMVLLFIAYIIAVPSLLLPPVMEAHKAMVEAKNRALEDLAEQIRILLAETDTEKILLLKDLLSELERRYEIATKKYRTWPFRPLSIKSFGVSAVMPIVSTGISYFIDLYVRR
jgi:hypothetical protein